eukprot:scaffold1638_cov258-Pinguiococcus_pyrenoidosus.AAC.87
MVAAAISNAPDDIIQSAEERLQHFPRVFLPRWCDVGTGASERKIIFGTWLRRRSRPRLETSTCALAQHITSHGERQLSNVLAVLITNVRKLKVRASRLGSHRQAADVERHGPALTREAGVAIREDHRARRISPWGVWSPPSAPDPQNLSHLRVSLGGSSDIPEEAPFVGVPVHVS